MYKDFVVKLKKEKVKISYDPEIEKLVEFVSKYKFSFILTLSDLEKEHKRFKSFNGNGKISFEDFVVSRISISSLFSFYSFIEQNGPEEFENLKRLARKEEKIILAIAIIAGILEFENLFKTLEWKDIVI